MNLRIRPHEKALTSKNFFNWSRECLRLAHNLAYKVHVRLCPRPCCGRISFYCDFWCEEIYLKEINLYKKSIIKSMASFSILKKCQRVVRVITHHLQFILVGTPRFCKLCARYTCFKWNKGGWFYLSVSYFNGNKTYQEPTENLKSSWLFDDLKIASHIYTTSKHTLRWACNFVISSLFLFAIFHRIFSMLSK